MNDVVSRRGQRKWRTPLALTPSERNIVTMLLSGLTMDDELADSLCVAKQTVRCHMQNIRDKTNTNSRAALVLWALRNGWTIDEETGRGIVAVSEKTNIPDLLRQIADRLESEP